MSESGLALHADGHDAPGNADVDARGFQFRPGLGRVLVEDLRDGVRDFVAVGIGELTERLNLLQLVSAKVVDFLVKGHNGSWV